MATTITINAVDRTSSVYVGGVSIEERTGSRTTMRAELYHTNAWRPNHGEAISLSIDGTAYFAGVIVGREETCLNAATSMLRTTLTATDYTHYTDRIITGVVGWEPDGSHVGGWTLKQIMTYICDNWLNKGGGPDFDIIVHPSQVDGPQFNYLIKAEWVTVTDVLNNLTTLSGYVWTIDASKQLRFQLPTSASTPVALTTSNVLAGTTISEEFTDYCNGVYVLSKNGTTTFLEDSGQITLYNRWHRFINAPELEAAADAQALAQKTLDRYAFLPKIVRVRTKTLGFHPGQTGTITLPVHGLTGSPNNEFMIQSVTYTHLGVMPGSGGTDVGRWVCEIEAIGGYTRLGGINWVDQWQAMMSGTTQSPMSISGATYNYTLSGLVDFQAYLGGSRHIGTTHSGSYTPVPGYVDVTIDSTKYSGLTIKARVWLRTENAGTSVTPRIIEVDGSTTCGTGTAATNTTWSDTPQEFDLTLVAGVKKYRLVIQPSNTSAVVYAIGVLYVA